MTIEATVTNFPRAKSSPKAKKTNVSKALSAAKVRKARISAGVRTFLTAVNIGAILVSLSDIAATAMHYGHVNMYAAYALALAVDASYISLEFAGLFAPHPSTRQAIHAWTRIAVPAIALLSAMANVTEFTANAVEWKEIVIGTLMGCALPMVAYVNNRVLAIMYAD